MVTEHDVDGMEIDDDRPSPFYKPSMRRISEDPTFYSDTDEEDWSSIGAAALRANSYSSEGSFPRYHAFKKGSRTRSPLPPVPHSLPSHHKHYARHRLHSDADPTLKQRNSTFAPLDFTGIDVDSQEREAIEALMKMGSL